MFGEVFVKLVVGDGLIFVNLVFGKLLVVYLDIGEECWCFE